jgi:Protein of unknown function (DUF3365)
MFSVLTSGTVLANDINISKTASEQELAAEARVIAQQFGATLRPKLKQALQSGGFEHAVKVCSVEAPEIAKQLSMETNWQVKRVSLKPRNSSNAQPNPWEAGVLSFFDKQQKQGIEVEQLHFIETIDNEFRFMKAQGVQPLCLNCHGTNIQPQIKKALMRYYPNDKATGYRQGEVRGAISLTKTL